MKETLETLRNAKEEIKQLRRHNEMARARLDMFDSMMALLHTNPPTRGYSIPSSDVLDELDREIAIIERNPDTIVSDEHGKWDGLDHRITGKPANIGKPLI